MSIEYIKRLGLFIILLLVQGLICNHIRLLNSATPLLYILFVLQFRRNHPRWAILLWSFALGLCVDIFANTPGVASASMTLVGILQPYLLELFVSKDAADDLRPSVRTLGGSYFWYAFIIVVLYCLLFFTIETFNFFNWMQWLQSVVGSSLITYLLIVVLENIRK